MSKPVRKGPSLGKVLVVVAIAGSAAFSLYLGYLEWSIDSFPTQQRPFADYAQLVYSDFNGTEYSFGMKWLNSSYLPMYAQLTSDTDAGNTPVCGLGVSSVTAGLVLYMPFAISQPSVALENVQLWVAVKDLAGGAQFTIEYTLGTVSATPGNVVPSNAACQEPAGVE